MTLYKFAFDACSLLVAPIWIVMILLPKWQGTQRLMRSPVIVVPFALTYAILEIPHAAGALPLFLRPTLEGIQGLVSTEHGTALGWIHWIAADLFVGRWMYLDSRKRDLNVFLMAPILFLGLNFGPAGFVCYMIVCFFADRQGAAPAETETPGVRTASQS